MTAALSRDSDPDVSPVFKACSCGAVFSRAQWDVMKVLGKGMGRMASDVDTHDLCLKNCTHCGSTISVYVEKDIA